MNNGIFKKIILFAGTLCFLCVNGRHAFSDEKPWTLIRESDGIKIYSRMIEGSKILEFKGVTNENVRIDTIAAILLDLPSYSNWIQYIKESKIIKQIDADNFFVYQRYKFLFPYHDRDIVVKITIERKYDDGIIRAVMQSVKEGMYPVQKDCIRIKEMSGEIIVKYVSPGVAEGSYSERVDPGGLVPDIMTKKINEYLPLVVLTKLKDISKKTRPYVDNKIEAEMIKALEKRKNQ